MAVNTLPSYDPDSHLQIFNMFKELFLSSFRYENLPEGINSRYLENALFENGTVAFFKDEVTDRFLSLKATSAGVLDVYFEPTKLNCYGGNGYQTTRTNKVDAVLWYNNFTRTTPSQRLLQYALRIAHIENTCDININAQKTPYLISATKDVLHSVMAIYNQIEGFKPAVITDKSSMVNEMIKVMKTDAPYVVDKLDDQKRRLINEALSLIGIENNSSEKSERLLADEILVSNGLAIANRNSRLEMRKMAIYEINKMFGLDISVEFNNPSFYVDPYSDRTIGGVE